ncbi:hypothetical protein LCGC14_2897830 [marine sediment metagenome]|uniref:Uncharacterized protein n=1 Tax=marine sediment metagenome TaxID=412755 RepID=A0A0F8XVB5_9ZZZZ
MADIPAHRLLRHALDHHDHDLAASIILAGSLEYLELQQAEQPMSIPDRVRSLAGFMSIDPQPSLLTQTDRS